MTRTEVLALYRPIRTGMQRVLREAVGMCSETDFKRALKQIVPWADNDEDLQEERIIEMLFDVAVFEPNQRGRRVYDRFLAERAGRFEASDAALAVRMASAWFSLFRVAERHEIAGLWLEDVLAENRRFWLMDESFENVATENTIIGLRVFDAGPFHAGFGIVVIPDAATVETCLATVTREGRLPFRHSLAATLYSDQLLPDEPFGPVDLALLRFLSDIAEPDVAAGARSRPPHQKRPLPRKPSRRKS